MPAAETRDLVANFCRRHGITTIDLTPMDGVTAAHRVCDLELEFAADAEHSAYRAQFKLQGAESSIGDLIRRVNANGQLEFAERKTETGAPDTVLKSFFRAIETRVAKVRHEQSIQNVTFLGNEFILNGRTVFSVVADDEGRLSIELHKGEERQPAVLLASSVLDGLYDGSIELLSRHQR